MPSGKVRASIAAAAATACVSGAAFAVIAGADSSGPSPVAVASTTTETKTDLMPTTSMPPVPAEQVFAVLKEQPANVPSDVVPPNAGVDPSQARLLKSLPGGQRVLAIPGKADLCVVLQEPQSSEASSSCGPLGFAERHGLVLVKQCDNPSSPSRTVVVLQPDDFSAPRGKNRVTGAKSAISVDNNVAVTTDSTTASVDVGGNEIPLPPLNCR